METISLVGKDFQRMFRHTCYTCGTVVQKTLFEYLDDIKTNKEVHCPGCDKKLPNSWDWEPHDLIPTENMKGSKMICS